jgi:hypothetical protein
MFNGELYDTLLALIEGCEAPPEAMLAITEVLLEVPLEVRCGTRSGELVFFANVPHSRWLAGFLPTTNLSHIHLESVSLDVLTQQGA